MPMTPRMHVSIDVDRYMQLPRDVKIRFDGWLEAEDLIDKRMVHFRLAEGFITATCIAHDEDGKPIVRDDEIVYEERRIPVRTLPPKEAFGAD